MSEFYVKYISIKLEEKSKKFQSKDDTISNKATCKEENKKERPQNLMKPWIPGSPLSSWMADSHCEKSQERPRRFW